MMPVTTNQGTRVVAERIRCSVQDTPVFYEQGQISITVSIGVTLVEDMHDLPEAISRADASLYEAKKSGRNRVCVDRAVMPVDAGRDSLKIAFRAQR
jgi:diguanylate cyclase (GGDEF)-like protein